MAAAANRTWNFCKPSTLLCAKPTPLKAAAVFRKQEVCGGAAVRSSFVSPIKAMEASEAAKHANGAANQSVVDSTDEDFGVFSDAYSSFDFAVCSIDDSLFCM